MLSRVAGHASHASEADVGRVCPYCRFAVKPHTPVLVCPHCNSMHHSDCWNDNGGCAITACAGGPTPASRAQTAVLPAAPGPLTAPPAAAQPPPPGPSAPQGGGRGTFVVVAVAAILASAAAGAAVVLVMSEDEDPRATETTVTQQSSGGGGRPDGVTGEEPSIVGEVAGALELSQEGRKLVLAGDYAGAAANRRRVLARIEAMPPAEGDLERSISALRSAMEASLEYDLLAPECAPETYCVEGVDQRADRHKARFVRLFNPYAERYLGRTYSASEI